MDALLRANSCPKRVAILAVDQGHTMRETDQTAAAAVAEVQEQEAHREADLLRARKRLDECLSAEDHAGAA